MDSRGQFTELRTGFETIWSLQRQDARIEGLITDELERNIEEEQREMAELGRLIEQIERAFGRGRVEEENGGAANEAVREAEALSRAMYMQAQTRITEWMRMAMEQRKMVVDAKREAREEEKRKKANRTQQRPRPTVFAKLQTYQLQGNVTTSVMAYSTTEARWL